MHANYDSGGVISGGLASCYLCLVDTNNYESEEDPYVISNYYKALGRERYIQTKTIK